MLERLHVLEILGEEKATWIASGLINTHCWFQLTPLPDDYWQFAVKDGWGSLLDGFSASWKPTASEWQMRAEALHQAVEFWRGPRDRVWTDLAKERDHAIIAARAARHEDE